MLGPTRGFFKRANVSRELQEFDPVESGQWP
jgi:hypothetical protein